MLDGAEPLDPRRRESMPPPIQARGGPDPTASGHKTSWLQQAAFRLKSHWLLKLLGTTGYMTLFMLGYFWLLRHPVFPVTVMPLTGLDRLIGFQPWSIWLYASLWLYISLVPMLLDIRCELVPYLSAVTILSLTGFAIFFFWPTAIPRPDINWARYPFVAFLKSVDASGNACPSLHVAFAVLTGMWLHRLLRQMGAPVMLRVLNVCWCAGIVYSTLALKQHVALDMEAGAILGAGVAALHLFVLPRPSIPHGELE
ncbi:MAG: phosphatase PAP2 family protein [Gammaproteobacteria bacterium]